MNSLIAKWLLFYPVRVIRGENVIKYMNEARKVQSFSPLDLKKFQQKKFSSLINENRNLPYLRQVLSTNRVDVKSSILDDLSKFPIINKRFVSENIIQFNDKKNKFLSSRSTSGSTGEPFTFFRDRHSLASMDAVMYNAYSWHGISTGDRQVRFWGVPFDHKKRREAYLKDLLMNRVRLSAFDLSESSLLEFHDKFNKFKPAYIYGYPSLIYEFAKFIKVKNITLDTKRIKAIVVTGEKLMQDQRKLIENVFNAGVVEEYGCSEIGVMAFECRKGNLHVMSSNVIIEVINENESVFDEPGEIVVTELNAKTFPFIRYKIGDIGTLKKDLCPCGLSWPILNIKEGRIDDYIITPDGNKVYDAVLAYTFNKYKEHIIQFKAYQRSLDTIDIQIVTNNSFKETILKKISEELSLRISEKISINFTVVDKIEREKSGKLRYFVSDM